MCRRPEHRAVVDLLAAFDGALFTRSECLFAGGTAIALQLGEFRRSDDIDFLCASSEGYRELRERVSERGLGGLGTKALPVVREARTDQYGIRAVLGTPSAPIKFEIVREARIPLQPAEDARIGGLPLLARHDLYAEKLLANADRGLDPGTLHRDLIDLCVMIHRWGPIPAPAWEKARRAYGSAVDRSLKRAASLLSGGPALTRALAALDADPEVEAEVLEVLGGDNLGLRTDQSDPE